MKRITAFLLAVMLIFGCTTVFAKSKKMDQDIPPWTEETVRQYALDYIDGIDMDRLWSYYDLQIRRYMPMETYRALLADLKWMTGDFEGFGSYRCFEEEETVLKVHVLHLCMEKQDMDLYFTHKNEEDDWEVMAVEFVPAVREEPSDTSFSKSYTEKELTIGDATYPLQATLTMPNEASEEAPAIGCVFIHDDGVFDRDMTLGQTKLFADFADDFGKHSIASLRYEKRAYAYPDFAPQNLSDEVITDAIAAIKVLDSQPGIGCIVLVGVGFGAELCPRIAKESEGCVDGIVMIGASGVSKLQAILNAGSGQMTKDEKSTLKQWIKKIAKATDDELEGVSYQGRSGFFYRELAQNDQFKILKQLSIPTYIVKGRNDPIVSTEDGKTVYTKEFGISSRFADSCEYRGLNHLLMNDLTTDEDGIPMYEAEAHLDSVAAQDIRSWLAARFVNAAEEE